MEEGDEVMWTTGDVGVLLKDKREPLKGFPLGEGRSLCFKTH